MRLTVRRNQVDVKEMLGGHKGISFVFLVSAR